MKTAKDKSTMMSMMGPVREELWSNDLKEYNTNNNKAVKLINFYYISQLLHSQLSVPMLLLQPRSR